MKKGALGSRFTLNVAPVRFVEDAGVEPACYNNIRRQTCRSIPMNYPPQWWLTSTPLRLNEPYLLADITHEYRETVKRQLIAGVPET